VGLRQKTPGTRVRASLDDHRRRFIELFGNDFGTAQLTLYTLLKFLTCIPSCRAPMDVGYRYCRRSSALSSALWKTNFQQIALNLAYDPDLAIRDCHASGDVKENGANEVGFRPLKVAWKLLRHRLHTKTEMVEDYQFMLKSLPEHQVIRQCLRIVPRHGAPGKTPRV